MARKALVVWGGWDGHQPKQVAAIFERLLKQDGFDVEVSDSLNAFQDEAKLTALSLIVPIWTMSGEKPKLDAVFKAVKSGVGMGGCHGGMCDSFRENTEWQFMTGGQWVAHPGNDGVKYKVNIVKHARSPIVEGIDDFDVASEQYYMHVDPAVKVLATTRFPTPGVEGPHVGNGVVDMPVVWAKTYGAGRVFYNSLGHHADVIDQEPCLTIMRRGFAWAAKQ